MAWYVIVYDALAHWTLAGFVLLAIATVVLLAIRQPARRIRVIEMTLLGLFAIPFLSLAPGYPRVAVLPVFDSSQLGDIESVKPDRWQATAWEDHDSLAEPEVVSTLGAMPMTEPSPGPRGWLPPSSDHLPRASIPNPQQPEIARWQVPSDYRFWIATGYLAGVGAMIAWSLLGLASVARLLRSARPADAACCAVLGEIAGRQSARVTLVVSRRAGQPCALVWRRPTIVLPAELAAGGDARQIRWALAHEWSHIARGDAWSWALSSVVRWCCFCQPLLWLLRRDLRLCQDYLADAAAALRGTMAEDYAEFLTSYASGLRQPISAHGLGMAGRPSELQRRIVMLVDNRRELERAAPRRWNLVALPLAVLLVAAVTSLGTRPLGNAAEPPASDSADDVFTSPPSSANGPATAVGDSSAASQSTPPADQPADLGRATTKPRPRSAPEDRPAADAEAVSKTQLEQHAESTAAQNTLLRPKIVDRRHAAASSAVASPRSRGIPSVPPFSGRLRPGDMLKIDLAGGFPNGPKGPTTAMVEPDGRLALGVLYGRVEVAGRTLTEAERIIQSKLQENLKDPHVQVTYEGHNPDVVPESNAAKRATRKARPVPTPRRKLPVEDSSPAQSPEADPLEDTSEALDHARRLLKRGYISRADFDRRLLKIETEKLNRRLVASGQQHLAEQLKELAAQNEILRTEIAELRRSLAHRPVSEADQLKKQSAERDKQRMAKQLEALLEEVTQLRSAKGELQRQLNKLTEPLKKNKPPAPIDGGRYAPSQPLGESF